MQNINDWLIHTIREDERKGAMSGWIEEKRFLILPDMVRTISHVLGGGSLIILTDNHREWFGEYIILHINQPYMSRPFLPIMKITHLHSMIDSHTQSDLKHFKMISSMLDMMFANYQFWYIGKKHIRSDFARECGGGWHWIFDENDIFNPNDELLDYKLISLFRIFDRAMLGAILNTISLDI